MDTLRTLFDDYIAYAAKLRKETASIKSVLGMRDREIYDAGHRNFDEAVEKWVTAFAATEPTQQALKEALEIILFQAVGNEGKAAYWYLCAVQRHAMVLLPLLDDACQAEVLAQFEAQYPKGRRLPLQNDIVKLLSKGTGRKRWGWLSMRG